MLVRGMPDALLFSIGHMCPAWFRPDTRCWVIISTGHWVPYLWTTRVCGSCFAPSLSGSLRLAAARGNKPNGLALLSCRILLSFLPLAAVCSLRMGSADTLHYELQPFAKMADLLCHLAQLLLHTLPAWMVCTAPITPYKPLVG